MEITCENFLSANGAEISKEGKCWVIRRDGQRCLLPESPLVGHELALFLNAQMKLQKAHPVRIPVDQDYVPGSITGTYMEDLAYVENYFKDKEVSVTTVDHGSSYTSDRFSLEDDDGELYNLATFPEGKYVRCVLKKAQARQIGEAFEIEIPEENGEYLFTFGKFVGARSGRLPPFSNLRSAALLEGMSMPEPKGFQEFRTLARSIVKPQHSKPKKAQVQSDEDSATDGSNSEYEDAFEEKPAPSKSKKASTKKPKTSIDKLNRQLDDLEDPRITEILKLDSNGNLRLTCGELSAKLASNRIARAGAASKSKECLKALEGFLYDKWDDGPVSYQDWISKMLSYAQGDVNTFSKMLTKCVAICDFKKKGVTEREM